VRPIGMNSHGVSEWPIGINLNRGREQQMRNARCAVRWHTGGKRETRHGGRHDREGPHFTRHTIPDPPHPLKAEWQGGSGISLSAIDHDDLISTVRELRVQFRTPLPPIKGRIARGLQSGTLAIDLGGWTLTIQIYSLLILKHNRVLA
jgi:hypothetical protein